MVWLWACACEAPGPRRVPYRSSLISSRLWSKKSLLFLMILMHTDSPVCRSRHCTAFENAAEPKYSRTWYL